MSKVNIHADAMLLATRPGVDRDIQHVLEPVEKDVARLNAEVEQIWLRIFARETKLPETKAADAGGQSPTVNG